MINVLYANLNCDYSTILRELVIGDNYKSLFKSLQEIYMKMELHP